MKKNYQQKVIKENAWGLHFTRWYVIAPSGNIYHFWRSCYWTTLILPVTLNALTTRDSDSVSRKEFLHIEDTPTSAKSDNYRKMIKIIYEIENCGGLPEQKQMNEFIENTREYKFLFSRRENSISYDSMP